MPRGRKSAHPRKRAANPKSPEDYQKGVRRHRLVAVISLGALLAVAVIAARAAQVIEHHTRLSSTASDAPLFGSSASNSGLLSTETAKFGHLPILRVYYPGLPAANAWTTGAAGINKSAIVVSFKASPSSILSGADNSSLTHFFDTAPTGHAIYYSYYPEPESFIAAGDFSLADFKAAWARVVWLADQAHNPNLRSTLILTNWDLSPQSGRNWQDYLGSPGIISTLGWDAYPAGTVHDNNPYAQSPADFMGPEVAAAKSVGLPFGFAEFGLATETGRAAWLTSVGQYLTSVGALFGTYFDSPGWPHIFMSDSSSVSSWRQVVAGSGNGTALPPAPTPAPTESAPPTASPTSPPTPAPTGAPDAAGPAITKFTMDPQTLVDNGSNHVRFRFDLSQAANVTICVLGSDGTVLRQLSEPSLSAGWHSPWYLGYDSAAHLLPPGSYPILVVASNAGGSTTTELMLTVTSQ
jgi:hypothetical protein